MTKSNFIQPAVCAIIRNKNKFLLTQRAEPNKPEFIGAWHYPGGGIEFGESPEDALHREIKEELGVEITNLRLLPKIFSKVRDHWHGIFICFICELKDAEAKIILNEESSNYGWFSKEEITKLKSLPKTNEATEIASTL